MATSIFPAKQKPLSPSIGLDEINTMESRVAAVLSKVRSTMLAPTEQKISPTFNANQLAQLIGSEKAQVSYRLKKGDLPSGTLSATGAKRHWTLAEVRIWARE